MAKPVLLVEHVYLAGKPYDAGTVLSDLEESVAKLLVSQQQAVFATPEDIKAFEDRKNKPAQTSTKTA